jgi:hypothetical protein
VARSVLSFAVHPTREDTYVIAVAKKNLAQPTDALTYRIESATVLGSDGLPMRDDDGRIWTVPRIIWLGTESISADTLAMATPENAEDHAASVDADDAILHALSGGLLTAEDFERRVLDAGVGKRTFERRRLRLRTEGYIDRRHGGGNLREPWSWHLTEKGYARLATLPASSPTSPWPGASGLGGSMAT